MKTARDLFHVWVQTNMLYPNHSGSTQDCYNAEDKTQIPDLGGFELSLRLTWDLQFEYSIYSDN